VKGVERSEAEDEGAARRETKGRACERERRRRRDKGERETEELAFEGTRVFGEAEHDSLILYNTSSLLSFSVKFKLLAQGKFCKQKKNMSPFCIALAISPQ